MNQAISPPAIRHRDTFAAEITKIGTHPATCIAVTLTLVVNLLFAVVASNETIRLGLGEQTAPLSAFTSVMFAPVYGFLVLPVYAAGGEHHNGQIRVTLMATPDRTRLVRAKVLAMACISTLAALIAVGPSRIILGVSTGSDPQSLLADVARWVVAYLLMSVVAFGLAGATRTTVISLAVLILVPILIATGVFQWPEGIRLLPDQAAMSMLGTPAYDVTELAPGVAALVLASWALIAVVTYAMTLVHRDT